MTRNNTTSYRKKGLSVFLTVLMVLSVVAMSATFVGTVAADPVDNLSAGSANDIGIDLENTSQDIGFTIDPANNGEHNVTINVSGIVEDEGAQITGLGTFSAADGDTTVDEVTYNDTTHNISVDISETSGAATEDDVNGTIYLDTSDIESAGSLDYQIIDEDDWGTETTASFNLVEADEVAEADDGPVEYHESGGDGHIIEITSEDNLDNIERAVVVDRLGNVHANDTSPGGDSDRLTVNLSNVALEAGDVTLQLYNDSAYQTYDVQTTSTSLEIDNTEDTAFVGEQVAFYTVGSADETLTIETPDRTVERGTGTYSEVRVVDSSGFDDGDYINVTDESGDDASIQLQDLDLEVESDDVEYEYDEGDTVEVTITGTSDYITGVGSLDITLYDEDDDDIETATSLTLDSNGEVSATFDVGEEGDYYAELVAVDSGISAQSDEFTVGEAPEADGDVSFGDITGAAEGDIATIELELEDAQDFSDGDVILWVNESDYNANITLDLHEDFDGDRTIEIEWNTFNAGASTAADGSLDDEQIFNVTNYDNVTANIQEETNISHADDFRLNPAGYTLGVFGDGVANDRSDSASLTISERSTGDMKMHIAPNSTDTSELDWVLDNATQSDEVAELDYLIIEQEITGIFGYGIDNGAFAADSGLDITISPEESPAYQTPETFNLTDGAQSDNLELVADAENGVLYFVLSHSAQDLDEDDSTDWNVEFEVNEDNAYIEDEDDEETVEGEYTRIDRNLEISVVEDNYQVTPTEDAVIEGTSTLAPGTNISITVDMPGQFIDTDSNIQVVDDADRSWQFSTDYSDKENFLGEEFSIDVEDDIESVSDSATGEFSEVAEADTETSEAQLESILSDLRDLLDVDDNDELEGAIQDLIDEIAALEGDLSAAQEDAQTWETLYDGAVEDLEQAESDLEEAQDALEQAESDLSDAQDEIDQLESDLSDAQDEIDQLESDLEDAEDDDQPAFGPIAALFALLAGGALVARRRL